MPRILCGKIFAMISILLLFAGCATYTTRVNNAPGRPTTYEDPESPGRVAGVGIESQDIISMTDRMMRDMLATKVLAGRQIPPRIIIDAEYFRNEGSSRINKNLITDRLRTELNKAANGRLIFIGRHYVDMFEKEKRLKRKGVVSSGTKEGSLKTYGADYRLGGRIVTLDSVNPNTGQASRFHQVTFEVVDLETGVIVWSGIYNFRKSAADDIIYR